MYMLRYQMGSQLSCSSSISWEIDTLLNQHMVARGRPSGVHQNTNAHDFHSRTAAETITLRIPVDPATDQNDPHDPGGHQTPAK